LWSTQHNFPGQLVQDDPSIFNSIHNPSLLLPLGRDATWAGLLYSDSKLLRSILGLQNAEANLEKEKAQFENCKKELEDAKTNLEELKAKQKDMNSI